MKIEARGRLAALTEKQKQLDINGDVQIDGEDLTEVREGREPVTAATPTEALDFVIKSATKAFKECRVKVVGRGDTFIEVDVKTPIGAVELMLYLVDNGRTVYVYAHEEPTLHEVLEFDGVGTPDIKGKCKLQKIDSAFSKVYTEIDGVAKRVAAYKEFVQQMHSFLASLESGKVR